MKYLLEKVYNRLLAHFGPCHWWPGDTPWEVMVGAVLTQNTAWVNVEKAIQNLKSQSRLEAEAMAALDTEQLAELVRPTGYYRQKAKKLKALTSFYARYDFNWQKMRQEPLWPMREKLLAVYGIGPETADSILLYALEKPIFVVDAYTRRILSRHGLAAENMSYDQIQRLFMEHLPTDVPLYNEYHALIVYTGKDFCRSKPGCQGCPLQGMNGER